MSKVLEIRQCCQCPFCTVNRICTILPMNKELEAKGISGIVSSEVSLEDWCPLPDKPKPITEEWLVNVDMGISGNREKHFEKLTRKINAYFCGTPHQHKE